jgi:hypothetical protein
LRDYAGNGLDGAAWDIGAYEYQTPTVSETIDKIYKIWKRRWKGYGKSY